MTDQPDAAVPASRSSVTPEGTPSAPADAAPSGSSLVTPQEPAASHDPAGTHDPADPTDDAAVPPGPSQLVPAREDGTAENGPGFPDWTVMVLVDEALADVDVDKILGMHAEQQATYRVLVPADTERNVVSSFLNHLSLFEMREAFEALTPVDRDRAERDAEAALSQTISVFEARGAIATGEVVADDPIPLLVDEVERLGADEVIVVTEPRAVEDTFNTDWATQAREKLGLPVLHMYAGDWRLG